MTRVLPPVPVIRPPAAQVEHCPTAEYPPAALRAGAKGTTTVQLKVDPGGRVTEAEVVRSAGDSRAHKLLDKVTLDALRKCRFNAVQSGLERTLKMSHTFSYTEEADAGPTP